MIVLIYNKFGIINKIKKYNYIIFRNNKTNLIIYLIIFTLNKIQKYIIKIL